MTAEDSAPRVHLERRLSASIAEVFAAWTEPAVMARWLSPTGQAEVEAEVRVGGSLRVVMIGDGMRIEHHGEFRVVEPPSALSFTWQSPYTGDTPSLVSVRLTAVSDTETHLELLHEQLPGDAVSSHAGGWGAILDNLDRWIAAAASPRE